MDFSQGNEKTGLKQTHSDNTKQKLKMAKSEKMYEVHDSGQFSYQTTSPTEAHASGCQGFLIT